MQSDYVHGSCAGRHFYGTENEIWACFGPDGNTEKNGGLSSATFEGVSLCFYGQFFFSFEYCSIRTKKLHETKLRQPKKNF